MTTYYGVQTSNGGYIYSSSKVVLRQHLKDLNHEFDAGWSMSNIRPCKPKFDHPNFDDFNTCADNEVSNP